MPSKIWQTLGDALTLPAACVSLVFRMSNDSFISQFNTIAPKHVFGPCLVGARFLAIVNSKNFDR